MAQVTIALNGREYSIGCGPGEEARIRDLARAVDTRIRKFGPQAGQTGETRLLVMMLLTMADELSDAKGGIANGHSPEAFAESVAALAKRIETVADRLEGAK
ncbi:MAG TPA: cell division protein ZapA [Stellaceae bacterium]|nr:cell division protein ZapA [Stellaceae bacterium]